VGGSTASRRVSEFVGVALFAAALIWIVSLASYDPGDPVWFFSTGPLAAPANFAGRVGAFLAELSFQLFGYGSYLIPAVLVVIGWHYFWCRGLDAAITKLIGTGLLFACVSAFLSLVFVNLEVAGKSFRAGGYAGEWLAKQLSEYLNRTGSLIVILTLIFLAIIMSTQFSFGRLFAALSAALQDGAAQAIASVGDWREERRREKQRREVIAKHTKKGVVPDTKAVGAEAASGGAKTRPALGGPGNDDARDWSGDVSPASGSQRVSSPFGTGKSFAPPKPPKVSLPGPLLPLPDSEPLAKAPAERRKGEYTLPPHALLDAPKTERKIDERELMYSARLLEE